MHTINQFTFSTVSELMFPIFSLCFFSSFENPKHKTLNAINAKSIAVFMVEMVTCSGSKSAVEIIQLKVMLVPITGIVIKLR